MIAEKMKKALHTNSTIREMFAEGKRLASQYGVENVFDFSLGNPSAPAPDAIKEAIIDIVETLPSENLHGYMDNAGFVDVREAVAISLNKRFHTSYSAGNIIMVSGAATGLNIILKAILNPDDEVVVFAPYFVEYGKYVENHDGKLVVVEADTRDFMPNMEKFSMCITSRTRAVIINSPNNPTGVIYSKEVLKKIGNIIEKKQAEFGIEITLISDEPYRELVYGDVEVAWIPDMIPASVVVYSYSKSLSLPGERIGWVLIPDTLPDAKDVFGAATIGNRILGSVNAPSLMQKVIARCIDECSDIGIYEKNRNLLFDSLCSYGFSCVKPEGAFYLFMKSPMEDDVAFCQLAKKKHILMVPGSAFACRGYVRIAYCVSYDTIERALPVFKDLAKECGLYG